MAKASVFGKRVWDVGSKRWQIPSNKRCPNGSRLLSTQGKIFIIYFSMQTIFNLHVY